MPEALCHLCGIPVGRRPVVGDGHAFCCNGCLHVWRVIVSVTGTEEGDFRHHPLFLQARKAGLIALPAAPGEAAATAAPAGAPGQAADDEAPALTGRYDGRLTGMVCPSCAWLVAEIVNGVDGAAEAEVGFLTDTIRFRYDPLRTSPQRIEAELARLGYSLTDRPKAPARGMFAFALAVFLTGNIMMISLVSYVGFFEDIGPMAGRIVPWLLLALAGLLHPLLAAATMAVSSTTILANTLRLR